MMVWFESKHAKIHLFSLPMLTKSFYPSSTLQSWNWLELHIINIISQYFITDQVMRSISSIRALLKRAIQLIGGSLLISYYFSCAQRVEVKDMMPYQYQFVKTRLRRVWSNRDMGLFSFWPISPQFAKESPPKPLKSVHPSGSHFGGPFSML